MKKLFAMALVLCMLLGAVSVASAEEAPAPLPPEL